MWMEIKSQAIDPIHGPKLETLNFHVLVSVKGIYECSKHTFYTTFLEFIFNLTSVLKYAPNLLSKCILTSPVLALLSNLK